MCCEDDALRFVTGYGVFENATTENALKVPDEATKHRGKPAPVMTDHGSQFYANEAEARKRGESEYEKLAEPGIKQMLVWVYAIPRPAAGLRGRTAYCGASSTHSTTWRALGTGRPIGGGAIESDPFARFIKWYNYDREHEALNIDEPETPAQAFRRKIPPGWTVKLWCPEIFKFGDPKPDSPPRRQAQSCTEPGHTF